MGTKRLRNSNHYYLTMENADLLDHVYLDDELAIHQDSIYGQKYTGLFIGEKIGVADE